MAALGGGIAYLAWLGVKAWREPVIDLTQVAPEPRSARAIFARGVVVSLTSPKSLLFYGAFFPQFMTPSSHLLGQMLLLCATFLAIAAVHDCCWALAAGWLRHYSLGADRCETGLRAASTSRLRSD